MRAEQKKPAVKERMKGKSLLAHARSPGQKQKSAAKETGQESSSPGHSYSPVQQEYWPQRYALSPDLKHSGWQPAKMA